MRLLANHGQVVVEKLTASSASSGKRLDELYPAFTGIVDLPLELFDETAVDGFDLVFVALPSGEAMHVIPRIFHRVGRIIDLGGDFRLSSAAVYEKFYCSQHSSPEFIPVAVYGLPELYKDRIAAARLVANPGCYPTSALLPLLPLLKDRLVSPKKVVITSLSGVSGAGRSASVELSFAETNENVRAYRVGHHQHIPEITSVLEHETEDRVSLSFVPHLVPLTRGIHTTIHASLSEGASHEAIVASYASFYAESPFVRIRQQPPQIRDVAFTNFCDIAFSVYEPTQQVILLSVIDNLVKGAAGQAIQNMNIMFGFPEEQGLLTKRETVYGA